MPAPSGDRQTVAELHREFAAKLKEQISQVRDARRVPGAIGVPPRAFSGSC